MMSNVKKLNSYWIPEETTYHFKSQNISSQIDTLMHKEIDGKDEAVISVGRRT